MSYNTRRSGNFGPGTPQGQAQSVGGIGQRRPVSSANSFVSGGQVNKNLNAQNKPGVQMQSQQPQRPAQTVNTTVTFRNQNQGYQTTQQQQQQQQKQQQQPPKQPQIQQQQQQVQQQQQQQQLQQQQQIPAKAEPSIIPGVNPPNPALENTNGEGMEVDPSDPQKKKPFWAKVGKISRKEKMRRRNVRLSKILQPKNAVMILNELVKNSSYSVEELAVKTDMNQFKASVFVDDMEHVGYGRSKIHAKNSAAEAALKHFIKSNKLSEIKKDEEGNEKMDVSEDGTQPPLPWQHVASFALYKLFTSWGEDPNRAPKDTVSEPFQMPMLNPGEEMPRQHENRPAKKMPDNPEAMNPLMLINQMLPHAVFEEIGKSGVPPNVTYSYRVTVDGQSFIGTGSNKKAAKKLAAFGACHKILGINYPKDVYVPIY